MFSRQYARALADIVVSDKLDTGEVDRQLREFRRNIRADSQQLREVFANPSIELDSKLKVLDAIVPRIGMVKQVRNFRRGVIAERSYPRAGVHCRRIRTRDQPAASYW